MKKKSEMESFDEIISDVHLLFSNFESNTLMVINENYEKHMMNSEKEKMIRDQSLKIEGIDVRRIKIFLRYSLKFYQIGQRNEVRN